MQHTCICLNFLKVWLRPHQALFQPIKTAPAKKKCLERWEEVLALSDKHSYPQRCWNYNLIDAVNLIAMTLASLSLCCKFCSSVPASICLSRKCCFPLIFCLSKEGKSVLLWVRAGTKSPRLLPEMRFEDKNRSDYSLWWRFPQLTTQRVLCNPGWR